MSNNINVINSDIIDEAYDVYWKDASMLIKDATPKPVLIITGTHEKDGTEQKQLQKMLEACKLVNEQYNILQMENDQKIAWYQLRELLHPKIIFLIGIMPLQLGISASFKLNEPNNFNDKIWLPTLSINKLEQHADAKKQLWENGMKPVFVNKLFGEI
jgi:hypothetical protein